MTVRWKFVALSPCANWTGGGLGSSYLRSNGRIKYPATAALDRLANASYQIVIEGNSYRERLSPHRALLDRKEVVDPQT